MSLKYSCAFLLLAALLTTLVVIVSKYFPWVSLLLLYVAVSFGLLSLAYAGLGPRLIHKSRSGRVSVASWVLFAPYLVMNSAILRILCLVGREPAFVEVIPNLFFGRRLSQAESEATVAASWLGVLDLTIEFNECDSLRQRSGYLLLPLLDGTAPTTEQLQTAITWMQQATSAGPIYVHCALGHGRSACVVAAYLVATGVVDTASDAVALLRSLRSGVRLHRVQFAAVVQVQREAPR